MPRSYYDRLDALARVNIALACIVSFYFGTGLAGLANAGFALGTALYALYMAETRGLAEE